MSESEQSFDKRLERAKLEAMKELAYGASHEINNPLANISVRAQTLLRDERDPDRRRALEAINQQALRAHEMISDLMLFARPPRLDLQPVDVPSLVKHVIRELGAECARRGIEVVAKSNAAVDGLHGDAVQLSVAVKAVITNSVEAIGRNGRIEVRSTAIEPQGVRIEVSDNGPGLSPRIRPHLFDPFFSGREAGRGLGFGLSKAWRIVAEHGGSIQVESPEGGGARFVIELPAHGVAS